MKNSNEGDALINQSVAIYLDGGWSVNGTVRKSDNSRIFVENEGYLYMVYRHKISAVCLNYDADMKSSRGHAAKEETRWPDGGVSDLESPGMSIPVDMLTDEAQRDAKNNDFSVYFGGNGNSGLGSKKDDS